MPSRKTSIEACEGRHNFILLSIFSIFKEWINEGMPLSTQSNEAAKLYDAAITQYIGWYDDVNVNGLSGSLDKMLEEDPNFSEFPEHFLGTV